MNETNDKQEQFFGTYFDRDSILRISRWADIFAWVTLTVYVLIWIFSLLLFISQLAGGMLYGKGMGFLGIFSMFQPYLLQPLPGVFYFFILLAISKGLLIMLDMEDNSRRAARK
ncbi:MAG TPA: hypothetical protein VIS72_02815 [Anaerolineales bacterium]